MSGIGVVYIAKGSRRRGRCSSGCGEAVTWATRVADSRHKAGSIPLVAQPIVIREEAQTWGAIEVIPVDQIHHCPKAARPTAAVARVRRSPGPRQRPLTAAERRAPVFAAFTPDRLAELRARLAQPPTPKPPQPGRLL